MIKMIKMLRSIKIMKSTKIMKLEAKMIQKMLLSCQKNIHKTFNTKIIHQPQTNKIKNNSQTISNYPNT